jgi:ABC-2 type transport system permease protein
MNTQTNAEPESPRDSQGTGPAAISETRPLYWSVRRELWENRSLYIAPLAVAAVYLLGHSVSVIWLPNRMHGIWMPNMRELPMLPAASQRTELAMAYTHGAMLLMLIGFIVGIFYSLEALHGERRDRCILFW